MPHCFDVIILHMYGAKDYCIRMAYYSSTARSVRRSVRVVFDAVSEWSVQLSVRRRRVRRSVPRRVRQRLFDDEEWLKTLIQEVTSYPSQDRTRAGSQRFRSLLQKIPPLASGVGAVWKFSRGERSVQEL